MPRTKLCKGDNDLPKKPQVTTTSKPDDLMSDFEVPDDLRKQLEYPAQRAKRQLAIDHVEKKLLDRLAQINQRLKEDNTRVSIQRVGGSLTLQATLPLKPGDITKDGSPNKQYKVSLNIPFNLDGLRTAEEEARELGTLIARKTFTWTEKYLATKAPKPEVVKTIGQLLDEFEDKYFMTRKRNRQSMGTFANMKKVLKRILLMDETLNAETITKIIQQTQAGTSGRLESTRVLSIFCNTFNFKFDFKGYRDGYKPQKRQLPTDKEIEEKFYNFSPSKRRPEYQWQAYQWVYGMLATYGLRPHEVFAIDIESFIDPNNKLHELKLDETITEGVKTGERTIFPLHTYWVDLFDLKNVKMPKITNVFRHRTNTISNNFKIAKIGFPPYNLRHAYAVRGHELGIPLKEMADNMGHSVDMHTKTYQKYMTLDTRRIVYQNAINKAMKQADELTEVERLKAEIAELRAKVESLEIENCRLKLDRIVTD